MNNYHIPVMLKEVISYLNIRPGSWYIDSNLGGGGHTKGILNKGGKVLGIDLDPDAIRETAKNFNLKLQTANGYLLALTEKLILYQSNFSNLEQIANDLKIAPVFGVLFDLGVSTHQLETAERGFSFNIDAPLDMRMDPNLTVTASDLIDGLHEGELAELFWKLGEERFAKPIARKINQVRQERKIKTTNELAQVILSVRHRTPADRAHPATRVFQALRIAVNDELNSLKAALPQALKVLAPGGRIIVISFHSLEDRIVKDFFQSEQKNGTVKIITKKPTTPTETEVEENPRSRSGKLRAAEKL